MLCQTKGVSIKDYTVVNEHFCILHNCRNKHCLTSIMGYSDRGNICNRDLGKLVVLESITQKQIYYNRHLRAFCSADEIFGL